mmetsp:Transcript_3649/g.10018  ORF Transcript_3649/g.10018 Transcript_3649/m.10018 type:complete len:210 (-) Transcript_3649:540-1169(-)
MDLRDLLWSRWRSRLLHLLHLLHLGLLVDRGLRLRALQRPLDECRNARAPLELLGTLGTCCCQLLLPPEFCLWVHDGHRGAHSCSVRRALSKWARDRKLRRRGGGLAGHRQARGRWRHHAGRRDPREGARRWRTSWQARGLQARGLHRRGPLLRRRRRNRRQGRHLCGRWLRHAFVAVLGAAAVPEAPLLPGAAPAARATPAAARALPP